MKAKITVDIAEMSDLAAALRKYADFLEWLLPTNLPPKKYDLIIFDMNGTLTNTPFIDKQPLHLLPGRKEHLAALREAYKRDGYGNPAPSYAIASNQGGVAFGFISEQEARDEVGEIAHWIGTSIYEVSFGHPKPKAGYEKYATEAMLARRKPAPGMLNMIMARLQIQPENTLMVGDMMEDKQAAQAAGIDFQWAREFFPEMPAKKQESGDPFLPDWTENDD